MPNASERKDVRALEKAARLADRERIETLFKLMATASGRAWVYSILERCHIWHSSFSPNALATAFAEGERNVGLRLLNDIMSASPDSFISMIREHNEKDAVHAARDTAAELDRGQDADGRDQGTGDDSGDEADGVPKPASGPLKGFNGEPLLNA